MKNLISLFMLTTLLLSVSCGKDSHKIITDVDIKSERDDVGDQHVTINFELDLKGNALPFKHLNLPNGYGMAAISTQEGVPYITLTLNLSEISKLPTVDEATLPNGTLVPVDTYGAGIVEIPIEDINGEVYVSFINGKAVVGIAIALSQFDVIGNTLGSVNAFRAMSFGDYEITAGVFASSLPGYSGVGMFVGGGIMWDETFAKEFGHHESVQIPYSRVMWSYLLKRKGNKILGNIINDMKNKNITLRPVLR